MPVMRVICPHCQTVYELQTAETDVVLVCHRCGTEFGLGEKPEGAEDVDSAALRAQLTPDIFAAAAEQASVKEQPHTAEPEVEAEPSPPPAQAATEEASAHPDTPPTEQVAPEPAGAEWAPAPETNRPEPGPGMTDESEAMEQDESDGIVPAHEKWDDKRAGKSPSPDAASASEGQEAQSAPDAELSGPPPRRKARIMPWLIVVMLLVVGSGLWLNRDAWLDDPWLRSVLINAGIQLQIRNKDWRIDPDSVSATWLKRQGAGSVLVITGDVHNKLQADLPPPLIHVKLLARDNPDETILERDMVITRPPLMQAIRQAPYTPPPQDNTPVGALDKRGFVLVLENLPQNAGNFMLSPKARQ